MVLIFLIMSLPVVCAGLTNKLGSDPHLFFKFFWKCLHNIGVISYLTVLFGGREVDNKFYFFNEIRVFQIAALSYINFGKFIFQ